MTYCRFEKADHLPESAASKADNVGCFSLVKVANIGNGGSNLSPVRADEALRHTANAD
jgi:hypothetical protein